MKKLNQEIKDLKDEMGEKSELLHLSYDRLADGGRLKYTSRKIDPETADAICRAFCLRRGKK